MRLSEPVYGITPSPMNNNPQVPVQGQTLVAVGGGQTTPNSDDFPAVVQQGLFVAVSQASCQTRLANTAIEGRLDLSSDDYLCADPGPNGEFSCDGDSGGPLFTTDGVLVGINSFNNGCVTDAIPDGFAQVSYFHDWIQAMI